MATILIGIDINQQCTDLDFGIDLPDDVITKKHSKNLEWMMMILVLLIMSN